MTKPKHHVVTLPSGKFAVLRETSKYTPAMLRDLRKQRGVGSSKRIEHAKDNQGTNY